MNWFQDVFGFPEGKYLETRQKFRMEDDGKTLYAIESKRSFHVGVFECLDQSELTTKQESAAALDENLGNLKFKNIVGMAQALHKNKENAGSVFQVASQFNCLEMVGPGVTPEHGITMYCKDKTQVTS